MATMLLFSASCSSGASDDSSDYDIIALYAPEAIGDLSYGDAISLALHKAANATDITLLEFVPQDWEKAKTQAENLLEQKQSANAEVLYVFCDGMYKKTLEDLAAKIEQNNKQVLLIDSRETNASQNIHTVCFSFYGIAYEAGRLATKLIQKTDKVDIIIGDTSNSLLQDAIKGFTAGLGKRTGEISLNEIGNLMESSGYNQAASLYWYYTIEQASKTDSSTNTAKLILPLCGGSIHGIFRYNRDYGEKSAYTIGMDTDMSPYTNRVPYSTVKHFDRALAQCLQQWIDGSLPHHQLLGLKAGFTETVLAPAYRERLQGELEDIHNDAIEKETAYENENK